MAVEMSSCAQCANIKVCKFVEDYEDLGRQACHLDVKEPFKVMIACPHYSSGGHYSSQFNCRDIHSTKEEKDGQSIS